MTAATTPNPTIAAALERDADRWILEAISLEEEAPNMELYSSRTLVTSPPPVFHLSLALARHQ